MSEGANEEVEEFEIDLGAMSDEELVDFDALLKEEYAAKRSQEEFSAEDREELTAIVEMVKAIKEEFASRTADAEADDLMKDDSAAKFLAARKAAAKAEELSDAAPEKEEEEVVVEEEVEEDEEEAKEDLAKAEKADVVITPKGIKGDTPTSEDKPFNVVASADIRGFNAGSDLGNWANVAKAFVAKRPDIRGTDVGADGNRFLVASVVGDFEESRRLDNDIDANMAKITAVTSESAIVASGGICAMATPYYQFTVWGDAHRPVRDALPVFQATRGGIRFMPAPVITDLAGSVRRTTAAQDAAGYTNQDPAGTTAPKPCLHVTCESEQSAVIEAIHRCLTFGNFGARTYPEQVEAWLKLGLAEFARYSETRLLDDIAAASTAINATQVYGAVFSLLEQISLIVVSMRARHRLSQNASFRALFPFWAVEILKSDIAAQTPGDGLGRFNISTQQVVDWLQARGVNVTFYQDHTTAAGAPFAAPSAGALWDWPAEVQWFIYPEGTFLYLDGGSLDLGLVRDSTLNSTNDYQIFYEEFNKVVKIGAESFVVTSELCGNGSHAPAADALRVCATS
jgi:hypothetical protein